MVSQWHGMISSLPFPIPGGDLIKSIDRVLVSSPGRNEKNPDEEPPLLIAVSGKFETGKLRQMLLKSGAKPQSFNSITIYRPQDSANQDIGFVLLNSQTLLIGDINSLCASIERVSNSTSAAVPSIVDRARDLDVAYDFWALLLTPPSAIGGDRFPLADIAGDLMGLEAGIAVRDGLAFDVNMHSRSEAAAKDIAAQFTDLIHAASKDKENHPEWSGLDRKLKVVVEHSDVHFAMRFDTKDVTKLAKAMDERTKRQQLAAAAAQAPESGPAKKLEVRDAPPEQKKVIRIEGLDGGTREIPYKSPPN